VLLVAQLLPYLTLVNTNKIIKDALAGVFFLYNSR